LTCHRDTTGDNIDPHDISALSIDRINASEGIEHTRFDLVSD
jgi:hypothetical protein